MLYATFIFHEEFYFLILTENPSQYINVLFCVDKVRMMDTKSVPKNFSALLPNETDLTMFTIQNLTLVHVS